VSFADKHILLITSTNLACNPRSLKELQLLNSMGAKVTVVAFNLHNWTSEKESAIRNSFNNVEFIYLEATKHSFFSWLFSSLTEKVCQKLVRYFPLNSFLSALAISKRSWTLLRWTKKWKGEADLIIAHNPPAFYPAAKLARSINTLLAIDIEDYHPAEGNNIAHKKSVEFIMKQLLPKTIYSSFASPLIKKYTDDLIGKSNNPNFITINNVFPKSEFIKPVTPEKIDEKLRLVWFSQFIDYGRGLEKILPVLDTYAASVELVLIGNMRKHFFDKEVQTRIYIQHIDSLSEKELNQNLSRYDIGLAIEDKEADMNRNICLTNKIWAYFQAGLYIIASDTDAQTIFLQEHEGHGIGTSLTDKDLKNTFKNITARKEEIRMNSVKRFEHAKSFNWESESIILSQKWKEILNAD
jgi:hypothetical protein